MGILTFRGNWLQKLGFPQRAPFFTGSDCLDNPQRPYNIFFFLFYTAFLVFLDRSICLLQIILTQEEKVCISIF